jgi:stalled ribosome rescue protein Dom34
MQIKGGQRSRVLDAFHEQSYLRGKFNFMSNYHAVVWIDHRQARVFHFGPADVDELTLHPDNPTIHIHHKANSIGSGHASADHDFLRAVTAAIADAGEILVTGPANAKTELIKYIHLRAPKVMTQIVGIETVDHPSDGQLVAFARKYFRAKDRLLPLNI